MTSGVCVVERKTEAEPECVVDATPSVKTWRSAGSAGTGIMRSAGMLTGGCSAGGEEEGVTERRVLPRWFPVA